MSTRQRPRLDDWVQTPRDVSVALVTALQDDVHSYLQSSAARAIGTLGLSGEEVLSALLTALADGDSWVRVAAARSLAQVTVSPEDVVPALIQALDDEDESVQTAASFALRDLGAKASPAVDALWGKVNLSRWRSCNTAASLWALVAICDETADAMPGLASAFSTCQQVSASAGLDCAQIAVETFEDKFHRHPKCAGSRQAQKSRPSIFQLHHWRFSDVTHDVCYCYRGMSIGLMFKANTNSPAAEPTVATTPTESNSEAPAASPTPLAISSPTPDQPPQASPVPTELLAVDSRYGVD